jgi:hypothetical protein
MKKSKLNSLTKLLLDAWDQIGESYRSTWELLEESYDPDTGEFNCDPDIVNAYEFWKRTAQKILRRKRK